MGLRLRADLASALLGRAEKQRVSSRGEVVFSHVQRFLCRAGRSALISLRHVSSRTVFLDWILGERERRLFLWKLVYPRNVLTSIGVFRARSSSSRIVRPPAGVRPWFPHPPPSHPPPRGASLR